jgi:hypothetical protein
MSKAIHVGQPSSQYQHTASIAAIFANFSFQRKQRTRRGEKNVHVAN